MIPASATRSHERLMAHSGLLFAIFLGSGAFLVAGWLPPVQPSLDAGQIAQLFSEDRTRIRLGTSMLAFGSLFWWTFSVALASQMRRMEGDRHPLADLNLLSSTGTTLIIMLVAYVWLTVAFRENMPADNLQLLNDFAWMCFVGFYPPLFLQGLAIGICILRCGGPDAPYPRWAGYLTLWCAVLFLPGVLVPFFQSGPFAWNGLIAFWLVATALFIWLVVMWWLTVRAVNSS